MSLATIGATAGITALIFLLISSGFKKVEAISKGGLTFLTGEDKDGKPFKVALSNEALTQPQYDIVELDTLTGASAITKKSDRPQYFIENADDVDKRVFAIALVPDSTFKTEAIIEIFLNRVRLFPITDPSGGFLSSVTSLNIPIPPNYGLKIKPRQKLEVFVYNPLGNSATVNFAVFVGNFA